MAEPILELLTLLPRPKISVDGNLYEILSPDELSIADSQRFLIWAKRIHELIGGDLDDSESDELTKIVRLFADWVMVGVPDDLKARLGGDARLAVIEVFMKLPRQTSRKPRKVSPKSSRSRGAKGSQGFSGSTAATPPAG